MNSMVLAIATRRRCESVHFAGLSCARFVDDRAVPAPTPRVNGAR